MRFSSLVLAATATLAACYTEEPNGPPFDLWRRTAVELTDAPFPYDSVARVDLYVVSIAVNPAADTSAQTGWVTVAEPRRRINLIALSGGVTDTLGLTVVPPGRYGAVRMVIDTDSSSITSVTGRRMSVAWQSSAGRPRLYALVEDAIAVPDSGTSVVIDFDVGRSFLVARGPGCERCDGFVFSPVFRAVNRFATGAVSGVVTGDTLAVYSAPIRDVTITVFSGDPERGEGEWSVRATGRTDATGHFRIAFLRPGTYILRADAPRASPFTPGVRANVIVTAGTEVMNQGITLPRVSSAGIVVTNLPPYAIVGDSLYLTAWLVDGFGNQVAGATITWSNLDTAVASLSVSPTAPARVLFRACAVGTARLTVTADGVSRTLTIPVLSRPLLPEVDFVRVTPDTMTIAVNDSVVFVAQAYDSAGGALSGRTYTWTSSDTTIATVLAAAPSGAAGSVRGRRAGTAFLSASTGGRTGIATVRVR